MATKKTAAAAKKAPAKKADKPAADKPAADKPTKAAKAPKEPKPVKEKAPKVEANGQVRPRPGGKTASVWDQADAITAKNKTTATRAEVMAWGAAQKPPLAPGMVATQYGRWRRFIGKPGRLPTEAKAKPAKAEKPAKKEKAAA